MKRKLLKRRCYFNHALGVDRHVWGEWKMFSEGKRRLCKRCGKREGSLNFSWLVTRTLKRRHDQLVQNISNNHPFLRTIEGVSR